MPRWIDWLRARLPRSMDRRERPEAAFHGLRAASLHPMLVDVPDHVLWSGALMAAMEINESVGITTIVAIADGTVNLYLNHSNDPNLGHGVTDAGLHAAVQGAAERFRRVVAESRSLLEVTEDLRLPDPGEVRFHARTVDGSYSGAASESVLRAGRHPLSPLYAAGQDLLTEIRLSIPS
jgi:hypothetical protein